MLHWIFLPVLWLSRVVWTLQSSYYCRQSFIVNTCCSDLAIWSSCCHYLVCDTCVLSIAFLLCVAILLFARRVASFYDSLDSLVVSCLVVWCDVIVNLSSELWVTRFRARVWLSNVNLNSSLGVWRSWSVGRGVRDRFYGRPTVRGGRIPSQYTWGILVCTTRVFQVYNFVQNHYL
jgi:hypothetical protein